MGMLLYRNNCCVDRFHIVVLMLPKLGIAPSKMQLEPPIHVPVLPISIR